ncbi:MAG: tRNA (guanosine(37)-N1)-methyltransferase TrmD [Bacteroidales bacterium]|nr:tRNA (guanosine(37)-N1)-methyltransferase TrmD [Bacteroidales bacterium]
MRIDIITLFPEMFEGPFGHSIVKRAKDKGIVEIHTHNLRDYSTNKHKKVDDAPYAGKGGMLMTPQPIADCIDALKKDREYDEIFYTSPDGELLDQNVVNQYSDYRNIIILCGHYKGIDERIREHYITKEFSIGDYVLSGGELAAMILVDSVVRIIPGAIGDEMSALSDSFQDGLVAPPAYTRPKNFRGWEVPEILLSGNEKKIDEWKHEQAVIRTKARRPGLLED